MSKYKDIVEEHKGTMIYREYQRACKEARRYWDAIERVNEKVHNGEATLKDVTSRSYFTTLFKQSSRTSNTLISLMVKGIK